MGISLIHSCASLVQLRTHPQVSFLPCGLDCILSPHTHTVCRPIPVQSLRRKHSLLQSKAVKQCSSSLSFSTQDSPRYQMNNSCMLGCYHRGRPLTEIPQRVSTFPGVVPALAAQAVLFFLISNLPAHLGSPVQGMSQQHTKNKQQQTMSLSRSVCATRWLRLFTPPISSNWRRAEAKKQTKNSNACFCCCFFLLLSLFL